MRIATIASALVLVLVTQTGCAFPFDGSDASRSDNAPASPTVAPHRGSGAGETWGGYGIGDAVGGAVAGSLAVVGDGSNGGVDTGNSGSSDGGADTGDSGSSDGNDDRSCADDGSDDDGDASDGSDGSDGSDDGSWDSGDDDGDDGSSDDGCDDCLVTPHVKPAKPRRAPIVHACKKVGKRSSSKISAAPI